MIDKLLKTHARANQLLKQYALAEKGWRFEFSDTKKRVGECNHTHKLIRYSRYSLESDWSVIEDVLLHEIAHALCGPEHGHDAYWKAMCRRVGANPERLITGETGYVAVAKANYVIKCPDCGREWKRYRMRQRNFKAICPDCKVTVKVYKYVN